MRLTTLCITLFLSFNSQSQIFIKGKSISGIPSNCDVKAICSQLNAPLNSDLRLMNAAGTPVSQNISYTDTINGLCSDASLMFELDGIFLLVAPNGDTLATSSILPINSNYTISNYVQPSSPVASDGTITFTFNTQLLVGFGPNNSIFNQNQINIPYTLSQDSLSITASNLHDGILTMLLPPMGDFTYIQGYIGDYANSTVNNNLVVDLNILDSDGGCNGIVTLTPDPTAVGVTYTWSEINYNGLSNISTMCPGYYRVLVEDNLGRNKLLEFTINDSVYNYNDPWMLPQNPTDTLNIVLATCNINYTQAIDSIAWFETLLYTSSDTSFYELNLTLYQDTNAAIFTLPFYTTTDTLVMLAIGFYCDVFKSNNFSGFKVYLSRDGSQNHYSIVGETQLKMDQTYVYPNPASDILFIKGIKSVIIYDFTGKRIGVLNEGPNNIAHLENGTYTIRNEENQMINKIIINR